MTEDQIKEIINSPTFRQEFDKYYRRNDIDNSLAIYHYANDVFKVSTMSYTYDGCTVGESIHLGTFDNIYDAQDCAEDYLKDLVMSQGV